LQKEFLEKLEQLDIDQCVYVDEAGIENSVNYAYGWSLKGTRCFAKKLGHFTERISMIAAYVKGKVFAAMTFTGYCDSKLVEIWFEKVLLPALKPNQVVILDNASFHTKSILESMLEKVGCRLLPLPPYSPELNKIEHLWHIIKTLVKHNDDQTLSFHDKVNQAFVALIS